MFKWKSWKVEIAGPDRRLRLVGSLGIVFLGFFSIGLFDPAISRDAALPSTSTLAKCLAENDRASRLAIPEPGKSHLELGTNICSGGEETNFYSIADDYLQNLFQFEPSFATQLGVHAFDHCLEDASPDSRKKENEFSRAYLAKFDAIESAKMSLSAKDDLELIKNHIKASLFEAEVLQQWKHNPDTYSSFVGSTVFPLIKRDSAPLEVRLKAVIAREKLMPHFLSVAEKNIEKQSVPRIFAELADEQLPGIIDFFKVDIPTAVKDVKNAELLLEFEQSNDAVVVALTEYQKFVKGLLTDHDACRGQFAIGAENFKQLLNLHEMVDEPLDQLLDRGEAELRRLQTEFHDTAIAIDPKASQIELFDGISKHHPPAEKLLLSVKEVLGNIRGFIINHNIVTIPGADNLLVEDTPPFMRATTFAAMDAPGAFEKKAKEAFYFVTLPEKGWDKTRVEEHMRAYSYPDLLNTSIHEAYPGHYVQALWNKQLATNVRRAFDCSSNAEGWAHYCEQMMLDEGFESSDRTLKLVQIHDSLLRCCRYIVAIKMHTQGMTVAQATDFFIKEGFQERANADREAKRGTVDPTYLVYTLGKLQILSMRDQVKQLQGDKFSLLKFHDAFLSVGTPPLKIVKAELWKKLGL